MSLEFIECDTCRALPGTPPLCRGCLVNREVIRRLQLLVPEPEGRVMSAEVVDGALLVGVQYDETNWGLAQAHMAGRLGSPVVEATLPQADSYSDLFAQEPL